VTSSEPVIIGIDPSLTCTAVCYSSNDGAEIVPVRVAPMGRSIETKFIRYSSIIERVRPIIQRCGRDSIVFIEGYAFGSATAAVILAEFGGLLRKMLLSELRPGNLHEIPPTSVKMYTTGKGNAKKPDMAVAAQHRWGATLSGDDEVDAYCIWRFGRAYLGIDSPQTDIQRSAVEKVRNPPPKKKRVKKVKT